jgi:hypothetical protein
VPLPDPTYTERWAFIIPKYSPYKGLINWRWVNYMKSISYIKHNLRHLWVSVKMHKPGGNVCLLLDSRNLNKWRYYNYLQFLQCTVFWWISLIFRNWIPCNWKRVNKGVCCNGSKCNSQTVCWNNMNPID